MPAGRRPHADRALRGGRRGRGSCRAPHHRGGPDFAAGRRILHINPATGAASSPAAAATSPPSSPRTSSTRLFWASWATPSPPASAPPAPRPPPQPCWGKALADSSGRPVRVVNVARVGSGARDLASQHQRLMKAMGPTGAIPDLVVVVTGANDVMPVPFRLTSAARTLSESVADLTRQGAHVVVATCPALGAVTTLPRPARTLLHAAGLRLARLQHEQALRTGGTVVLHREVSPAVAADPTLLADDGFHPGDRGYALAADKLLTALAARPDRKAEPSQNPGGDLRPLSAGQLLTSPLHVRARAPVLRPAHRVPAPPGICRSHAGRGAPRQKRPPARETASGHWTLPACRDRARSLCGSPPPGRLRSVQFRLAVRKAAKAVGRRARCAESSRTRTERRPGVRRCTRRQPGGPAPVRPRPRGPRGTPRSRRTARPHSRPAADRR
ncbi:hypothetical protein Sfr7A_26200 [Streptomyces xinghaiensis]|uniref:SGNH hydrolase-type esterase domain-containing protein n=1 Tax=Streptomyces xinghaiensis TaxID=1038928 RepID=A0A3M8EXG5_9ACTN|nr:hypothetical protein Sfr7A_26200 [Streptomyces xinghaiensis]RKM92619.1 hypothetical protein SFRA_024850 [Streptomyces xinghaiensis]RNC70587.1 hypothetical protein DC095_025840 [Streptomyces xinghaiensis]